MGVFHLTQAAKADLKGIGRYTQREWGTAQRNLYLTMLDSRFQALADDPRKGRDCGDIREGYRKHGAGSHVIFYRQIAAEVIEIVRILHNRMDFERHLQES